MVSYWGWLVAGSKYSCLLNSEVAMHSYSVCNHSQTGTTGSRSPHSHLVASHAGWSYYYRTPTSGTLNIIINVIHLLRASSLNIGHHRSHRTHHCALHATQDSVTQLVGVAGPQNPQLNSHDPKICGRCTHPHRWGWWLEEGGDDIPSRYRLSRSLGQLLWTIQGNQGLPQEGQFSVGHVE